MNGDKPTYAELVRALAEFIGSGPMPPANSDYCNFMYAHYECMNVLDRLGFLDKESCVIRWKELSGFITETAQNPTE